METFLKSNEWQYRLARTIVQGVLSVVIVNIDLILGMTVIPMEYRPVASAAIMAVLSPIMTLLGDKTKSPEGEE